MWAHTGGMARMTGKRVSPSPGAVRARESRARKKAGLATYQIRTHRKRLIAALRRINSTLSLDELSRQEVEAELTAQTESWIAAWIGRK